MDIPNLQLYNMRLKGVIESEKYNVVFESLKKDIEDLTRITNKNTQKLLSNAEKIIDKNFELTNTIRHLENKYLLIKNYIQRS